MHHAVILAGGQGTRLWPWSHAGRPKHLLPLLEGRSLLEVAIERGQAIADEVWLATGEELARGAAAELHSLPANRVVVEPSGRDTLPAIVRAMHAVLAVDPDAVVSVLTADHVIEPLDALVAAFTTGVELASAAGEDGQSAVLVTYGVVPDHAATGYGWLELGEPLGRGFRVSAFREKPELDDATTMLDAGPDRYLWNSGMFTWSARGFLDAAATFAPEHARGADPSASTGEWDALTKLSVDHGVMEPSSTADSGFTVAAVPLSAQWRDIGSWTSLGEAIGRDAEGNATTGRVLTLDATDNVVASDDGDHLIALLGVEGLVVVHTPEATLVCRADDAQRVKELQALVAREAPDRA